MKRRERMMLAHNALHGWHRDAWRFEEPYRVFTDALPSLVGGALAAWGYMPQREARPTRAPMSDFLHPLDATEPCPRKGCRAPVNVPCSPVTDRERSFWRPGMVHLGRRVNRIRKGRTFS